MQRLQVCLVLPRLSTAKSSRHLKKKSSVENLEMSSVDRRDFSKSRALNCRNAQRERVRECSSARERKRARERGEKRTIEKALTAYIFYPFSRHIEHLENILECSRTFHRPFPASLRPSPSSSLREDLRRFRRRNAPVSTCALDAPCPARSIAPHLCAPSLNLPRSLL